VAEPVSQSDLSEKLDLTEKILKILKDNRWLFKTLFFWIPTTIAGAGGYYGYHYMSKQEVVETVKEINQEDDWKKSIDNRLSDIQKQLKDIKRYVN